MGDCFYCSKAEPVVQTKAGKIRGFKMNSTYTFHGIKYADAGSSVDGGYDPTSLLANG